MSPVIEGTRAQAKFVRMSAKKVRPVLDLIRGEPVVSADEILQFTPRAAAVEVRKVLRSAIANAAHNDDQIPEELFVAACYADEGPTLKRFRPRARGRATRINKRTAHITVIVDRLEADELERLRAKRAGAGVGAGAASGSRSRRVAASRGDDIADDEIVDEVAEDVTDEVEETTDEAVDQVDEVVEETTDEAVDQVDEVVEDVTDEAVDQVEETADASAEDENNKDDASAEDENNKDDA